MTYLMDVLIGMAVGAHISTWGMYKDAIHEGFTVPKYLRSTMVGLVLAPVAATVTGIHATSAGGALILFGMTYALERAVTEFYKTYLRNEDQSKYFIPMQFHVMGRVIQSLMVRVAVGVGMVCLALVLLMAARALQPAENPQAALGRIALVASFGGWFSAFGGAFKDAPIEGFETLKFFRSPVSALLWGLLISRFTPSYPIIALSAIGFTVATLETYKTFFFPSVPRGKFAGKPILHPEMLQKRQYFVPLYASIWVGILVTVVSAIRSLDPGA